MRNYYSCKGFTLVETIVSAFILLIIIAATFMVLGAGRNTFWTSAIYIELHQGLRKAEEWISKELRQGRRATLSITGADNESISFQIPSSVSNAGAVTWQGVQYYLSSKQIKREADSTTTVLVDDIDSLTFTQDLSNPQKIEVAIESSKKDKRGRLINASLTFDIKLRN